MATLTKTATPSGVVLTAAEVASQLRCSRRSIYRAIERGDLAAVRLGPSGSWRITAAALAAYLKTTTQGADE